MAIDYVITLNSDEVWTVTWFEDSGSVYVWQTDRSKGIYIGKAVSGEEAASNGLVQIIALRSLPKGGHRTRNTR